MIFYLLLLVLPTFIVSVVAEEKVHRYASSILVLHRQEFTMVSEKLLASKYRFYDFYRKGYKVSTNLLAVELVVLAFLV